MRYPNTKERDRISDLDVKTLINLQSKRRLYLYFAVSVFSNECVSDKKHDNRNKNGVYIQI
jgi:hypothetical protein